jgi:alpha-L-arabinofuranosidase
MDAHQPVDQLDCYIQDALDLIEFANGDIDTQWGGLRAQMGHPEPFGMKFIGIGNEQWGPEYPERLEPFIKAIRSAYPEIQIVGSSGPNSEGEQFDFLWSEMERLDVDLVDEHFYRPESWFLSQGARYDDYDRKGPKVFAGEYACHGNGKKWNHFEASLLEAAFMTTLERNADIVHMSSYAPLFAHVEGWQWRPDLIWFDNLRSFRSCSWYIQKLYMLYSGTNVLKLTDMEGVNITGADGVYASSVYDADNARIYIKVINVSDQAREVKVNFEGLRKKETLTGVEAVSFHSDDPDAENTLDEPFRIVPQTGSLDFTGNTMEVTVSPNTFMVYVIKK